MTLIRTQHLPGGWAEIHAERKAEKERAKMKDPAESMVERGVKALYDAIEATTTGAGCLALQGRSVYFEGAFDAKAVVHAVIAAMREMTPVIRDHDGVRAHQLVGAPDDIWKAFIDVALSEETGG